MGFNFKETLSAFMVLFAIIDILGSIPIIIDLKKKSTVRPIQTTLVAYIILLIFLFLGEQVLTLFGINLESFAVAGAFVLFFIGLEMILGITFFKHEDTPSGASIVPLAFPLIAGAGSFTALLSLRAEYQLINVIIALTFNLIVVFIVLKATNWFEKLVGQGGIYIMKKFFGVILLAIAIKLFMSNTGIGNVIN